MPNVTTITSGVFMERAVAALERYEKAHGTVGDYDLKAAKEWRRLAELQMFAEGVGEAAECDEDEESRW